MNRLKPIPRHSGIFVLLLMAGFAAFGFSSIRRDLNDLRQTVRSDAQWAASQMEIELLQFRLSLAAYDGTPSAEAFERVHQRFDIFWSRVFMLGKGALGERLESIEPEGAPVATIADYLQEIDPLVAELGPDDGALIAAIDARLGEYQKGLHAYTLAVLRDDLLASARLRGRIRSSAASTALVCFVAVIVSVLLLVLVQREYARQRELARMSRQSALVAERASRAKSRFLAMMNHELRNPLNGVLGPLALLARSGRLPAAEGRLVTEAQRSGRSMLQMLSGLMDYGESQDGNFQLRIKPMRVATFAGSLRAELEAETGEPVAVQVLPGVPERIRGDADRLRQIFLNLGIYAVDGSSAARLSMVFGHDGGNLVGDVVLAAGGTLIDWKLDLIAGLDEADSDRLTSDALRPMMARSLIAAMGGSLSVRRDGDNRRSLRVTIPSGGVRAEQLRVRMETRSAALAAIYRATLRSDRIHFVAGGEAAGADIVLIDSSGGSVDGGVEMSRLRARYPAALFVSIGTPATPADFDDVVESPRDLARLRSSILARLAS